MALSPGTHVGQYEVAASIGAGGMGEVYRARDRKLGRDVAIKALPSALASDSDRLTRLEQEARILARLNHPNIGTIYGLEESGDASYLVLELIDGETLDERLARTGPIPLEEALRIGSQIADALDAANARGITHRDIKPSNIKVTSEGRVKVLDFGIARSVAPTEIQDDGTARQRMPDDVLAESLRGGKVVLGYGLTFHPGARTPDHGQLYPLNLVIPALSGTTSSVEAPFFKAKGVVCSLKPLAVAAAQAGFLNAVPDSDGVLRRVPLLIELNGRVYPSLPVAAVAVGTASRDAALSVLGPNHGSLSLGQLLVPLDGRSNLLLRYRGRQQPIYSEMSVVVIAGQTPVTSIRDKIVFVGTTALGHAQGVATPLDTSFVGASHRRR
jgi:serine/threonine protein kinase